MSAPVRQPPSSTIYPLVHVAGDGLTVPARVGVHDVGGPYNLNLLSGMGYTIRYTGEDDLSRYGRPYRVLRDRAGGGFEQTRRVLRDARDTPGLVMAVMDGHAAAWSLVRRWHVGVARTLPFVAITCWFADNLVRADRGVRPALVRRFRGADMLTCFSQHQREILEKFGFGPDQVAVVPFGVDTAYMKPSGDEVRDLDAVAIGMDRGRDYETLGVASHLLRPGTSVHLYAGGLPAQSIGASSAVTSHGLVDHDEYRSILRRAKVVVIPTHEMHYPSGQTVLLDAQSAGAAVVTSDSEALGEYLEPGRTALTYPVHDAGALARAVTALLEDETLRRRIAGTALEEVGRFDSARMWAAVAHEASQRGLLVPPQTVVGRP